MDKAVEAFARKYYGNAPVARDPQIIGAIRNALSAADAARAVGDEEVVLVMANNQSAWHGCDDTAARCASEDCGCKDDAQRLLKSLRAAGLKVVRG